MNSFRGALFDLGSNSIKFMLAEQKGATLRIFREEAHVTRLAENLNATGRLSRAAMARSIKALQACCSLAADFGAEKICAVGTSAVRSASNRGEFLDLARKKCGLRILPISGREEGRLVFAGISSSRFWSAKPILAVDIGGGSAEFVAGQAGKISSIKSLPLGCVRVTESLTGTHPVSWEKVDAATDLLRKKIAPTLRRQDPGRIIVASGGTASALAWLQFPPSQRPALDQLEGMPISLKIIDSTLRTLAPLTVEAIDRRFKLPPGRAEIVLAGAVVLRAILLEYGAKQARFASRGLRYGLWQERLAPVPFRNVLWQNRT